jgi:hypothetical protein
MRKIFFLFALVFIFSSCGKKERYLVVSKIQNASKLATTETTLEKVVFGTQKKKLLWIIKLSEARFIAYTKATVWSGIDLSELSPHDVEIDGKRINIELPHVRVLEFRFPFDSFRIDSSITKNALFNRMDITDYEYFYQQAELDIRNHLEKMGIIEATQQKTRTMLTGLLRNLGYEEIYITFKESKGRFIEKIKIEQEDENTEQAKEEVK